MNVLGPASDPELWEAFQELVRKASPPTAEPSPADEVFTTVDRLLHERPERSGALVLMLSFFAHGPMVELMVDHFGSTQEVRKAKVIVGWPVVDEAAHVMQLATDLVARSGKELPREQLIDLLAVLEHGWTHHTDKYVRLLNCLVWLVAALREGTVSIGPALDVETAR